MQRVFITVIIALFAYGHYAYSQLFFDMSDDPLMSIWANRDSFIQDNLAPCNVQSSGLNREGTCMSSVECKKTRGSSVGRGNCTVWNSCCVYEKTCNQTARGRVVYFRSPTNARLTNQVCTLNIEPVNDNICQIRVDILDMNLADPVATVATDAAGAMTTTVTCSVDRFYVTPNPTDVMIPPICGSNTNTHFYVHLDQTTRRSGISLNFLLSNAAGLAAASWNIKVTQLECPSREKKINLDKKKENPNQAANDFGLLAPPGCLQYFTDPTGTVKSFGFTSTAALSTLVTNQDYSTCFKRYSGSCGVTITPTSLVLRDVAPCPAEYISIPELPIAGTQTNDRVCIPAAVGMTLQSTHPGPLYVHFHSNPTLNGMQTINGGFMYTYAENFAC